MKIKILLLVLIFAFITKPFKSLAQIYVEDSLALIDFYDSTNGNNWKTNTNWKTANAVKTWYGITVSSNRVTGIYFTGNNLTGRLPSSFGNLDSLKSLTLIDNKMSGSIPASIGNFSALTTLDLGANGFSGNIPSSIGNLLNLKQLQLYSNFLTGSIPVSLQNLNKLQFFSVYANRLSGIIPELGNSVFDIDIGYNQFTFKDIELLAQIYKTNNFTGFHYSPQANINISKQNATLYVSPGGTLENDTLRWYKTGAGLIATIIGDTSYKPDSLGSYYVKITNSIATKLTLSSDTVDFNSSLADTVTSVTENISGTSATDFSDGIYKILSLTPTVGADALNGSVTATVFIDTAVPVYNNQPYVERHYDITPSVNADNAQATVTLYFTQQEFDNFNTYVINNNLNIPLLPAGGVDNGNVRILQLHGTFTGSSTPGNYNDPATVFITPIVVWDNTNNWWAVTFPVLGFSGFYLSTANFTLPVTLVKFSGRLQNNHVSLTWITTDELNTKQFIIESNNNSTSFTHIGNVAAQSTSGIHQYSFIDTRPLTGNSIYRLKMIDKDGNFTYSNIVSIKADNGAFRFSAYPNPAKNTFNLKTLSVKNNEITLFVINQGGELIMRKIVYLTNGENIIPLDVSNWSVGSYFLKVNSKNDRKYEVIRFVKQ
ncbi:MAG: T9SS type A sorting domain-containing protein [Ginsengibacter sp.]